jgi:hypothetical protein
VHSGRHLTTAEGAAWASNCVRYGQLAELELEVLQVVEGKAPRTFLKVWVGHQRAGIGGTVGPGEETMWFVARQLEYISGAAEN